MAAAGEGLVCCVVGFPGPWNRRQRHCFWAGFIVPQRMLCLVHEPEEPYGVHMLLTGRAWIVSVFCRMETSDRGERRRGVARV